LLEVPPEELDDDVELLEEEEEFDEEVELFPKSDSKVFALEMPLIVILTS
jgi:hypothetical protein